VRFKLHGPHDKIFIALIEREVVPYRLTLTRTPLEYSMEVQRAWSGPLISPSAIVPNDGKKPEIHAISLPETKH
jgi:hypothetical protein